ncbi:hypothetical protein IMCC21906_01029 [Spongiibacter sp. IMCC21906]|nr:hypothetical protein IMCC21906_01029 [Spongiibacter sp. IMCC21906]
MKSSMASTSDGQLFARSELGIISFANYLDNVSHAQASQELSLARKNYQRDNDSYNTLRLAAALMQTSTNTANLQQAENILHSYVRKAKRKTGLSALTSSYNRYEPVAQFLLNHLEQRKKIVAENLSLKQKIEQLMLIENKLSQPQATTFR